MTQADSIFGAEPDRVKRLLAVGAEASDMASEEDASPTASVGALMEKPGTLIGRYKLLRVLGEGGMGIVYLAQQQEPVKREVALKVIKPGMDSKRVIARFEAEQQALALMEHPHVARVHDAGLTPSGRPYFVMEHVKGVPITKYCDEHRLTIEERLRLFLHVCEAIQYAHQKGIIHRDIKPSNILVSIEDGQAAPKVIDFGVARAISRPLTNRTFHTEQGQLVGTPDYMSPEQVDLSNQDIDTRTDVYSLGILLYELIAGILPFDPQALREHGIEGTRKVICEEEPQTPSTRLSRTSIAESTESAQRRRTDLRQLQRKLRGDLDWITLKAMEKDRTRRYASAGDLAADVHRHLNQEPVTAARPSLAYKARKFVRRNRALVTALAAVMAVLISGVVVSLVFAFRAERAGKEAAAVAEFLQEDVFGAMDASERGGRQVPIKEILDIASQKVPSKFGKTPLHEASIRKTLGALYSGLSEFEEAERHLRRSLEIFTRERGREDLQTVEVVDQLGRLYWGWWRYREAEQHLSEALRIRRRLLGSDHPDTVDTMAWLGWTYYAQGYAKKAELLLAEAYNTARRTLGDSDKTTLECMCRYGGALLLRGRYAEAERVLHDALELSQKALIPVNPSLAFHTSLLGRLYSHQGRYEEAEELLGRAFTASRDAWGEHSGGTFHCVAALAENYARQGRIAEAEALMLNALGRGERTNEPRSEVAVQTLPYIGFYYLWQKRYDDAEHCVSESLRESLDSYGEEHPITFLCRIALGMIYREQGRYDEAETQLAKAVDFTRHYNGGESVRTADAMHQLAGLYQQQGRYAEAEELHLEILDIRRKLLVENHPHTLGTIKGLIALYAAWDKHKEARKWFDELRVAYANQSAAHQYTRPRGTVNYDPATEAYTLAASPLAPWALEKELAFSYPEPSSEMWHICDELHFAHKMLSGDGSITARIESIDKPYLRTRVGVMIRNTLGPASENIAILITPTGRVISQYRTKQWEATQSVFSDVNNVTLPYWVRLMRKGNQFTTQHSSDGVNWHTVQNESSDLASSIEIPLDDTVHIGLAITPGSPTRSTQAHISHVNVTGSVTPDGPFIKSNDIHLLGMSSTTSH
ncbi:MAG: tetratricopeptide repeat protein [Phycisphaerales bacterium]|nr:MAG: tetratricopeptide repeat protein [Phycisphaerales bacterium]